MNADSRLPLASVMDAAFRLYRDHAGEFFTLGLVMAVPGTVLGMAFGVDLLGEETGALSAAATTLSLGPYSLGPMATGMVAVAMFAVTVSGVFGLAATAAMVQIALAGGHPTLRDGISEVVGSFWTLTAASLALTLAFSAGLALFLLPGILIYAVLCFTPAIVVLERRNLRAATARSFKLTRGRRTKTVGALVLSATVVVLSSSSLMAMGTVAGVWLDERASWLLRFILAQAAGAAAAPLWFIAVYLLYFEARVDSDALDVHLLIRAAASALEPRS